MFCHNVTAQVAPQGRGLHHRLMRSGPTPCAVAGVGTNAYARPVATRVFVPRRRLLRALRRGTFSGQRSTTKLRTPAVCSSDGPPVVDVWPPQEVQSDFEQFHAGRWESSSATFFPDGVLAELPAQYIPENFKEWGQTMHEWLSLCDTSFDGDGKAVHTLKRLWPTSGCEFGKEDVALEEEAHLFEKSGTFRVLVSDGHYCDGPARLPDAGGPVRFELGMALPSGSSRARIVLEVMGSRTKIAGGKGREGVQWRLTSAEAFLERRRVDRSKKSSSDGAEDNLEDEDGDRWDGFSKLPPLDVSRVEQGVWEGDSGALFTVDKKIKISPWWAAEPKLQWALATRHVQAGGQLLPLPQDMWAYVEQANATLLVVEAGIFTSENERIVVSIGFSNGARSAAHLLATDTKLNFLIRSLS